MGRSVGKLPPARRGDPCIYIPIHRLQVYTIISITIITNLPLYTGTPPCQSPHSPLTIHQVSQFITSPPLPPSLHLSDMIPARKERRKLHKIQNHWIGFIQTFFKERSSLHLMNFVFRHLLVLSLFLTLITSPILYRTSTVQRFQNLPYKLPPLPAS